MDNILIVDDSPVDRMLAVNLLKKSPKFEVLEAEDGKQALAILDKRTVSVVVTDVQMPGINGLELLEEVINSHGDIPVILMTAKGSEELAVEALERGAASYVPKRRLAAELASTVERVWCLSKEDDAYAEMAERLVSVESRYRFENDLEALMSAAASLPLGAQRFWDCSATIRMQLSVSLEEALTNSYFYGNLGMDPELRRSDPDRFYREAEHRKNDTLCRKRRINVIAKYAPDRVEFTITDEGAGFDPKNLPPDDEAYLNGETGGRGLRLMRTFMDEVNFNERGNEVTLIKQRTP